MCAGTLVPMLKRDGGIRPIAVGDTLRRLSGKVLLSIPEVRAQIDEMTRHHVNAELVCLLQQK